MMSIPILMYHEVSPQPSDGFRKYTVTPRAFANQMRWLVLSGHTPIGLDELLAHRESGGALPRRAVVITFDDGFADCAEYAAPILREFGFTATFYIVAGLMGRRSHWLRRERGVELPLMSWNAARELQAAGFTIGAHSLTHPHLTALPAERCSVELQRAREMLEQRLGRPVAHLAYPYGSYDERVRQAAAQAGYRSGCTVRIGLSLDGEDPLALRRVPVTGADTLMDFIVRLRTAGTARDALRRAASRVRGRHTTAA